MSLLSQNVKALFLVHSTDSTLTVPTAPAAEIILWFAVPGALKRPAEHEAFREAVLGCPM